jgi:Tfp pilus assembly protein PilV
MLSNYLTPGEGASVMLVGTATQSVRRQRGYSMLEALVSCSLALIASVGLWKLISATRQLASRGLSETKAQCAIPECSANNHQSICVCGEQRFVVLH